MKRAIANNNDIFNNDDYVKVIKWYEIYDNGDDDDDDGDDDDDDEKR